MIIILQILITSWLLLIFGLVWNLWLRRSTSLWMLHLSRLLLRSLCLSSHLLLIHVRSPSVLLSSRLSAWSWTGITLWRPRTLWLLSAWSSCLNAITSCWKSISNLFWHKWRSWLLKYLLNLLIRIIEPVLKVSNFGLLVWRTLKVFHSQKWKLFSIQEFSKVCQDEIDVLSRVGCLTSGPEKECLLEEMKKCLIFVDSLLSNLEMSSLLPKVCHKIHLIWKNVTNNRWIDVFSRFEELVSKSFSYFLDLSYVLISNHICKSFLPGAALFARKVWGTNLLNDSWKIVFGDSLYYFFNKNVFMKSKILGFNLIKELLTSRFSNQESLSSSSGLQSYSCSPT